MMTVKIYHCSFRDQFIAYHVILPSIRLFLGEFVTQDTGLLEVAISEALTNALDASHGQPIFLTLYFKPPFRLRILITDHGKGFDVDHERLRIHSIDLDEDPYCAESGRGLWIMHQVFDHVQYNSRGNKVLLTKEFNMSI